MWRKYRDSIIKKSLKRIRGRKSSLIYQKQILSVNEIFTYSSKKQIFYHFYVKGNLPHIQKNRAKSQFLAIQLSKGSSVLLLNLIREVLKREGSKQFFFIQYPIYPQFNINYLLLLIHIRDESLIPRYEDSLRGVNEKFKQAIENITSNAF
jgi:hypothetical protein